MSGESGASISSLLDKNTLAKLTGIGNPTEEQHAVNATPIKEKHGARKDLPYVQLLKENPELGERMTAAFQQLAESHISMPLIHITSRAVALEDGREIPTGYIENITENGFRARDTNVAAFAERANSVRIGSPAFFRDHPEKFLRELAGVIKRYKHHGTRTNKASLAKNRGDGVGRPTMLVVDSRDARLIKGTDYDDHFILENHLTGDHLMGQVDLTDIDVNRLSDLKTVAENLISQINVSLSKNEEEKKSL